MNAVVEHQYLIDSMWESFEPQGFGRLIQDIRLDLSPVMLILLNMKDSKGMIK